MYRSWESTCANSHDDGTWYEIATIPQRFQRGCVGVTASYSPRKDVGIQLVNTCYQGTLDGSIRRVRSRARVVGKTLQPLREVRPTKEEA